MKYRSAKLFLCMAMTAAMLLAPIPPFTYGSAAADPSLCGPAGPETGSSGPLGGDSANAEKPKVPIVGSFQSDIQAAYDNNGRVPGEIFVTCPLMPVDEFLELIPESIEIERLYDTVAHVVGLHGPLDYSEMAKKFKWSIFNILLTDKSNENTEKAIETLSAIDIFNEVGHNTLIELPQGEPGRAQEPAKGYPKIGVFDQWIEGGMENGGLIPGELIVGTRDPMRADIFLQYVPQSIEIECLYDIVDHVLSLDGNYQNYEKFKHSIFHIKLKDRSMENSRKAIEQLSAIDKFIEVGFNTLIEPAAAPNDAMYPGQWNMRRIGVPDAWNVHAGSGAVSVAVIDTGIDYFHEDLVNNVNIAKGYDAITATFGAHHNLVDNVGHGTQVAGIIGAQGNNGKGIAGVNWDVEIVPIRVTNISVGLLGGTATGADVNEAISEATNMGIPIANISYQFDYDDRIVTAADNYPGLLVLAAGNSQQNIDITPPGQPYNMYTRLHNLANVIVVAGLDQNDSLYSVPAAANAPASGSNYGTANVDIAAPGFNVSAPQSQNVVYPPNANKYIHALYGTSFAAPHVAGAAALLKSYKPSLSTSQLKYAIINYSESVPGLSQYVAGGRILSISYMFMLRVDFNNNIELDQGDLGTYMANYYQLREGDYEWDNTFTAGLPPAREADLDFNGVINMTDYLIFYAHI